MHLGNNIICPVTGLPMLALMGTAAYYAFKNAKQNFKQEDISKTTLLTGLVFALQMINFSIPQTGSSGHVIGAMLLAILLNKNLAFLSISLILVIQALFFADGGLLALGCNIFNMGFLACYVAYPFIYKPLENKNHKLLGIFLASIIALLLGSIAAAIEAAISGSIGNLGLFLYLMQGIHLAIGVFEGIFSVIIVSLINKFNFSRIVKISLGISTVILASVISNYASIKPDGLEWSLLNIEDKFISQTQGIIYQTVEAIQTKLAIFNNSLNPLANIVVLGIVCILMFIICKSLTPKTVEVKE